MMPALWIRSLLSRRPWVVLGLLLLSVICRPAFSQQPSHSASTAIVTFTLDFPESVPTHYSIAVDETGHASYECTAKVEESSEEQNYRSEFNLSAAGREKIFEWTKQAKYFSGKIDSGNQKLALMGWKILSYQDGQRSFTARYNYSNLEPVRQLTTLFQNIAGTQDYGRRLTYYHRYQKLALDEELKHMEAQARNNELSEIQGVAQVLQEIVEDTSVINVVRARAKAVIEIGDSRAESRQR
jgi:hypothetical protein